jgi:hypothetical protein
MTHTEPIRLGPESLDPALSARTILFLDTNIWIDLAEQRSDEACRCFQLLTTGVTSGRLLCPVAAPLLWELFKQNYESAQRVAQVMDSLSLSTSFAAPSEVHSIEAVWCAQGLLRGSVISVPRSNLLVPIISYLSSDSYLEFSDTWPAEQRKEAATLAASRLRNLNISQLVKIRRSALPQPEPVQPPQFAAAHQRRAEHARNNKRKAWLIEAHAVASRELLPRLAALKSRLPPDSQAAFLAATSALPRGDFGTRLTGLLKHTPSLLVRAEIMTLAGFDTNRKDSMRDFYDREMMIIPLAYADAFASHDRWIRHILGSPPTVLSAWPARFLPGLREVSHFVQALLTSPPPRSGS